MRQILIHLNVRVAEDDPRSADEIEQLIHGALEVGSSGGELDGIKIAGRDQDEIEPVWEYEIKVGDDHAEAEDADSALVAAYTLVEDALDGVSAQGSKTALRRKIYITKDGQYDGRLTMLARSGVRSAETV